MLQAERAQVGPAATELHHSSKVKAVVLAAVFTRMEEQEMQIRLVAMPMLMAEQVVQQTILVDMVVVVAPIALVQPQVVVQAAAAVATAAAEILAAAVNGAAAAAAAQSIQAQAKVT
jgi:hypothetical protein